MPGSVLILGTGALACLFGARLARFGRARVTLAGTWAEGLRVLAERGITVQEDDSVSSVAVTATPIEGPLGPADLVLVLVKSHQTAAVAPAAVRALAPGGLILTLQNGLGNREVLERSAGAGRVAVGVTTSGATLLGPARVKPAGRGRTVLGAEPEEAVARVAALLEGAGLATETTAHIDQALWRKLAVNCAINPLSALRGVTNGALLEDPVSREALLAAAREAGAVAAAQGIALGVDPGALALELARTTAANRSSMLQDLDRGARTEIDAINGAVARAGQRLGVPTPIVHRLWQEVLEREARPGDARSSPPGENVG